MASMSSHLLTEPKYGRSKRIKVWPNGESEYFEININPRYYRSFTAILLDITNTLRPTFGAVRKLLALSTMEEVNSFEDLDTNEKYIALGINCKFKTPLMGYRTNSENEIKLKKRSTKKLYVGDMGIKKEQFLIETKKRNLTIMYVVVNGRSNQVPQKVVFNNQDMKNWDIIHKYLTKILDIPEGIGKVYTIFGQEVKNSSDLQHGFLYVAVPFQENFVNMDYEAYLKNDCRQRSGIMSIRPATVSVKQKNSLLNNEEHNSGVFDEDDTQKEFNEEIDSRPEETASF